MGIRVCLLAFWLAALAFPAQATVIQAQYTGKLYSIYDPAGFFFRTVSGRDEKRRYKARFVYDTALGKRSSPSADYDFLDASSGFGNPMLSATLRVNGRTHEFIIGGSGRGSVSLERDRNPTRARISHGARSAYVDGPISYAGYIAINTYAPDGGLSGVPMPAGSPVSVERLFGYKFGPRSGDWDTFFEIRSFNSDSNTLDYTLAAFAPGRLTVSAFGSPNPAMVPLPSTVVLLLAGLASLSTLAFSRSKRPV